MGDSQNNMDLGNYQNDQLSSILANEYEKQEKKKAILKYHRRVDGQKEDGLYVPTPNFDNSYHSDRD